MDFFPLEVRLSLAEGHMQYRDFWALSAWKDGTGPTQLVALPTPSFVRKMEVSQVTLAGEW